MYTLKLDRRRHWLPSEPTELDELLQREFPGLDLFSYWHKQTRRWAIAEWLSQDKGRAVEIMALDRGFPCFRNRTQYLEFRERVLRPQTAYEMRKISEKFERDRQDEWDARSAELDEGRKRLIFDAQQGRVSQPQVSLYVPKGLVN